MLAEALHGQLGPLKSCVPIIQIAKALGIEDIKLCPLDGIEGMLLTDRVRSTGSILANTSKGEARKRFTVAHELGHFLLERHEFENTGFTCSAKDMKFRPGRSTHQRQEAEANQFAIAVLAPPYRVRPLLGKLANLANAITLRNRLEISFDASVRVLVDYCSQPPFGR